MKLTSLRATKELTYNTRRMLPGDTFEASPRDARLLVAIRKAEAIRAPANVPPPPPAVAEKIAAAVTPVPAAAPPEDMTALRAEYAAAVGRNPFMGWDAATLREKIAAATTSHLG